MVRVLACSLVASCSVGLASEPPRTPDADPASKLAAGGHPLITEVLYDVPKGSEGDADQDGSREATGDEFVELINPHGKPINLKGYVLVDSEGERAGSASSPQTDKPAVKDRTSGRRTGGGKDGESAFRFTFPDLELAAGEVVVVFNGFDSRSPQPVGDAQAAPAKGNEKFGGARVLSLKNTSKYVGFSNTADSVRLIAPDGTVVETIGWGAESRSTRREGAIQVEANHGSVARVRRGGGWTREFVGHTSLPKPLGDRIFSPGVVPPAQDTGGMDASAEPDKGRK